MINIILQAVNETGIAGQALQLSPVDIVLIASLIGGVIYLALESTGTIPLLLRRLNLFKSSNNEDITSQQHSLATLIPASIRVGSVDYPILVENGIETIKVDEKTGTTIRRYHYVLGDGREDWKDATDEKIQVEVNPDLLEGRMILFKYIGDSENSAEGKIIDNLRTKLQDANSMIDRLKEELREARKPEAWKNAKKRQRLKGSVSSRRFSIFGREGGGGGGYDGGDDDEISYNDEEE